MIDLFPKQTRPYYIATPSYDHRSSGVRTLHLLCHAINKVGYKAQLAGIGEPFYINHDLDTPVATLGEFIDPIVIYPDIVKGNTLNARSVVRYLMAERGKFGGDTLFADTDQIWGALPTLAENVLRIPCSDPNIFYLPPKEILPRKGACFYSHKYDNICGNKLLPITENATRLRGSLKDLAKILRESEVCYVYELTSAMTEAAMCGCPVVLIRTPFFNSIDPTCMMGNVTWDDGEVVKKCEDFRSEYQKIIGDFPFQLAHFIEKTQAMP